MTSILRTALAIAALMLAASVSAVALRPTHKLADAGPKVNLEAMVPKQFGDWKIDESIVPIMPAPDVQEVLARTYSQTLSRTYINTSGYRVMLSIAYGSAQDDGMNYHRPEVCYPAQGFTVVSKSSSILRFGDRKIEAQKLLTTQHQRTEPIIYWIVIGDQATEFGLRRKLATIRYGVSGVIPDGLLFRVSAIDKNADESFIKQMGFIGDLHGVLSEQERRRIFGGFGTDS